MMLQAQVRALIPSNLEGGAWDRKGCKRVLAVIASQHYQHTVLRQAAKYARSGSIHVSRRLGFSAWCFAELSVVTIF